MNKIFLLGLAAFTLLCIVGILAYSLFSSSGKQFTLSPKGQTANAVANSEAVVSWSTNPDYLSAITEAVSNAKDKLGTKQPKFAYVVYISEENHDAIISEVRKSIGPGVKIYGHTSNTIITNDKVIDNVPFAIGVLLVASDNMTFGMGSLDQNKYTGFQAGKVAITQAIQDAGKTLSDKPEMVLYMGTTKRGKESEILSGVASVIGKDVPVIGGNAKDFGPKFKDNWKQFTDTKTYDTGLMLVTLYAPRVGWGFEATFKLTDKQGTVTKSDGFRITQIDGKPALDVYDNWVNGEFYKKLNAGDFNSQEEKVDFTLVKGFTLLNPIAKIVTGPNNQTGQFATSPIPDEQDVKNKSITVYAQVNTGDKISLYSGTWQVAMNRVETIPTDALFRANLKKGQGAFAVMAFCNGLKTVLPKEEFEKVPAITNDTLGVPFLGAVTAGEQGPIPGIGNVNANIVESIVIAGK